MEQWPYNMSLSALSKRFGGWVFHPDCWFSYLSTDSRTLEEGDLFLALKGDHFDGHDFCGKALAAGASGLVVEQPVAQAVCQWVVEDSLVALRQIAQAVREIYQGCLIAITGSAGKTTVKEMLNLIMRIHFGSQVSQCAGIASRGNLNNEIGVPLTLLRLQPRMPFAIIEIGARHAGDIAPMCELAQPTVALVNNVGKAHIGCFGSIQTIIDTKGEIYSHSNQLETGVVNLDSQGADQYWRQLKDHRTIGYSLSREEADLYACVLHETVDSICFELRIEGSPVAEIELKVPGRHNVANALAAASCAWATGVDGQAIATGLSQFKSIEGRLSVIEGLGGCRIIDDTYNASPDSVFVAIEVLSQYPGSKVLVLGDMLELGEEAMEEHRIIFRQAQDKGIRLLSLGTIWGRLIKEIDEQHYDVYRWFNDSIALIHYLQQIITAESILLIKGSRAMGMEQIVKALAVKDGPNTTNVGEY